MPDLFGLEPRYPLEASSIGYTPSVPGNWSPAPDDLAEADDQLAARTKALETAAAGAAQTYVCLAGDAVRSLVYQSGSGTVAKADASNASKMPAIGFIASKPTTTSCVLQDEDELSGFVGLTAGAVYYADPATPGGITATLPDVLAGNIAQQVGVAKSATVLRITIATPPPVNP